MVTGILLAIAATFVGGVAGYVIRREIARTQVNSAEAKAADIILEAEKKAKEELVNAKKKALESLENAEKKIKEKEDKILQLEQKIEKKEENIYNKMEEIDQSRKVLEQKAQDIRSLRHQVEEMHAQEIKKLEEISELTQEQALERIFKRAEEKNKGKIVERISRLEKEGSDELERKANNIMVQVIQRYARSHASEVMTSTLTIPSEDIKGKIIGKEGRNIRTLERLTGVEVLIDDTPETVVVSSFDPVRREVAKITLEKLIEDGRINPARIEEMIEVAEKEINQRIKEAGEAAAYEVGVAGLDPKLIHILGSLRYRTSFKQNVLLHSLEVSFIAGALAAELGYNVNVAKRAGLLHDIGKAIDHKVEGTHVNIGMKVLQKFGIQEDVILAMRSHHEEYPYATPEAYIVTAADAISASRPGARKDSVENYIKRLEDLENLVNSFEGVEKSYAIQAGREVRIFVNPEKVDDAEALKLARSIADRIEEELNYPGEIKVNVMREMRAIEIAR